MTLALDGSVLGNVAAGTSLTVALTTASSGDVIVVIAACNACFTTGAPATISDAAGLAWTLRASTPLLNDGSGNWQSLVEWYAVAPAALASNSITITQSGAEFITVIAFGVSGADTSAPFDVNATLPATASSGTVTVSTTAADTFVFGAARLTPESPGDLPAPWTTIETGDYGVAGYQIFSAAQTNLTVPLPAGGTSNGTIGDAIVAAAALTSGAVRGAAAGVGRVAAALATSSAPLGLGGPPRGPRPILTVRGIFRKRWRRYRLSQSSLGPVPTASSIGRGAGGSRGALSLLGTLASSSGSAAGAGAAQASSSRALPVGLGGPPRGPRPIVPVRGIFRRRWRRYRLSNASAISQGIVTAGLMSRGGARGPFGTLAGTASGLGARSLSAAQGSGTASGRVSPRTRAASSAFAGMAGIVGTLFPAKVAGKGAARATVAMRGAAPREAALSAGGPGARLALRGSAFTAARAAAGASGWLAGSFATLFAAPARAIGGAGGQIGAALGGLLAARTRGSGTPAARIVGFAEAAGRAATAARGRLSSLGRGFALAAAQTAAASVGRLGFVAGAAFAARAGGRGVARTTLAGAAAAAGRAGAVARARVRTAVGVGLLGAMTGAGAAVGRAAHVVRAAVWLRVPGTGVARAASLGALAGWLAARGAAPAAAVGGSRPLAFDSERWMLPPVAGLVMTALRRNREPLA